MAGFASPMMGNQNSQALPGGTPTTATGTTGGSLPAFPAYGANTTTFGTPYQNPYAMPSASASTAGQSGPYQSPYAGQPIDPMGAVGNNAPVMPEFNPVYNPETQSLAPQIQGMLNKTSYDTNPLKQIEQNATSNAPSTWAQMQSQLARTNTSQAAGQAANQTAAATAGADSNLAMSGGLSSGARERAAIGGEQSGIAAQQNVANQGNTQQLQIGATDAATKQAQLMALPGMETQAYQAALEPIQMYGQAASMDTSNSMNATNALNNFNMGAFQTAENTYGNNQVANATADAAKHQGGLFGGGGFLGLGF